MQQERFLRSARQARNFFHLILPSVNIFMYLAHASLTPTPSQSYVFFGCTGNWIDNYLFPDLRKLQLCVMSWAWNGG